MEEVVLLLPVSGAPVGRKYSREQAKKGSVTGKHLPKACSSCLGLCSPVLGWIAYSVTSTEDLLLYTQACAKPVGHEREAEKTNHIV